MENAKLPGREGTRPSFLPRTKAKQKGKKMSRITLRELTKRIYAKAKAEPRHRFWGLYVHVCKQETLEAAYKLVKANKGAAGIDGVTFADIERAGVGELLKEIEEELREGTGDPWGTDAWRYLKAGAKSACWGSLRSRTAWWRAP